ncbi:transposase [Kutzneria sp. 744]|nr:transposase [Kutzneria sp. 744]
MAVRLACLAGGQVACLEVVASTRTIQMTPAQVGLLHGLVTSELACCDGVAGCVVHTDRGSQFRSRKFVRALVRHGLTGSMGRVGAAGDNAAMESFFALLQNNVLNRRTWSTRTELRTAIVAWIERTYHRRRRQAALSRLTPIEYEAIMTTSASQAA